LASIRFAGLTAPTFRLVSAAPAPFLPPGLGRLPRRRRQGSRESFELLGRRSAPKPPQRGSRVTVLAEVPGPPTASSGRRFASLVRAKPSPASPSAGFPPRLHRTVQAPATPS